MTRSDKLYIGFAAVLIISIIIGIVFFISQSSQTILGQNSNDPASIDSGTRPSCH